MIHTTLKCNGCQQDYVPKYEPRNSTHYCSKSCSNKYAPRRKKEGQCKTCQTKISASRTYCPPCFQLHKDKNKQKTKERKKAHMKSAVKSYMRKSKEKAIAYKGGKCQSCGYNRCNAALDFHHINSMTKSFNISGRSISFDKLRVELDKCVMVCANCHREIHAGLLSIEKVVGPLGIEPRSIG